MVAVALYATDPASRRLLERLAGEQAGVTIVGTADSPGALARLLDRTQVEAVLADARPFLTALLAADRPDAATAENGEAEPSLTPREIEGLSAMAGGPSNKVIARPRPRRWASRRGCAAAAARAACRRAARAAARRPRWRGW